jgi:hypothetical protein
MKKAFLRHDDMQGFILVDAETEGLIKSVGVGAEEEVDWGFVEDQANQEGYTLERRGGKREGAGRKPSGKRKRNYYVTDQEHEEIKRLIEKLREQS